MKFKLFPILITIVVMGCKKEKSRICALYDGSVGYSIGTIDKYITVPSKVTYSYSFEVDAKSYEGKEKVYGIGQKDETLIGKSFVVVYNVDNPGESDLNFNYPIESQADFQNLVNDFGNNPPSPDWPKCE